MTTTLTFNVNNLGKDATLMLTFDKENGMYIDKFPVCWKAITFPSAGSYRIPVTFASQIAFCKPQVDYSSDTIRDPGVFTTINIGQKTTLLKANNIYRFTSPVSDAGSTTLKAYNGTQIKEDMGLGFVNDRGFSQVTPVLFFKGVDPGSFVQGDFKPILRAYVTSEYTEMQIIKGELITPAIWEQNLDELYHDTFWDFKYNKATDEFTITQR